MVNGHLPGITASTQVLNDYRPVTNDYCVGTVGKLGHSVRFFYGSRASVILFPIDLYSSHQKTHQSGPEEPEPRRPRREIPSLWIRLFLDQSDGSPAMRIHVADVAG